MRDTDVSQSVYRFGAFELDPRTGELRKRGVRLKLQDQPLRILVLLLEHSGELVTREQIQTKLWTPGTYLDHDNAINGAVRKLRDALGDTAESPRFIETFARRGYRFIGHIETPPPILESSVAPQSQASARQSWKISHIGLTAVVFLSIASAGAWWVSRSHPQGTRLQIKPAPLTAAAGWEGEPSFSPDGAQVAYVWDEGAGRDLARHIFVKLVGEGRPLRLTSSPNQDRSPAWSPDGRSIAFVRVFKSSRGIYVIPALGGAERKVADGYFLIDDFYTRSISWSPDGRFLAAAESNSPDASTALVLLNLETGERLRLTTPPDAQTSDINPAFSPDGRKLLFTRCSQGCGLYVLVLSRSYRPIGGPASLGQAAPDINGVAWTADGRDIVYSLDRGNYDASLMRVQGVAGAKPERFTFTEELPFYPFSVAVAPRGNRLAYTALLVDTQIWQVETGKSPRSFAPSSRIDSSPEYSPDGKRVAFASTRSGGIQIWTCDSNGGNPTQVTHFDSEFSGSPRWSPDGRSIAFDHEIKAGWGQEKWGVFVTASDGSQLRKLSPGEAEDAIPSWSADGKWIYYSSNRTNRFEIWKVPANGGKSIQITSNGGWASSESTDGRSLYYTRPGRPGLWERPLLGGKEELLLTADVGREFAVAKEGIYYLPVDSRSVRFHSFATGKDDELAHFEVEPGQGLTVSPDRKTILFTAELRTGTNVMVVDNFR